MIKATIVNVRKSGAETMEIADLFQFEHDDAFIADVMIVATRARARSMISKGLCHAA
jgi:hypothetical protein